MHPKWKQNKAIRYKKYEQVSEHNFCNFMVYSEYDQPTQSYTGVRKRILIFFYAIALSFFYTKL